MFSGEEESRSLSRRDPSPKPAPEDPGAFPGAARSACVAGPPLS